MIIDLSFYLVFPSLTYPHKPLSQWERPLITQKICKSLIILSGFSSIGRQSIFLRLLPGRSYKWVPTSRVSDEPIGMEDRTNIFSKIVELVMNPWCHSVLSSNKRLNCRGIVLVWWICGGEVTVRVLELLPVLPLLTNRCIHWFYLEVSYNPRKLLTNHEIYFGIICRHSRFYTLKLLIIL